MRLLLATTFLFRLLFIASSRVEDPRSKDESRIILAMHSKEASVEATLLGMRWGSSTKNNVHVFNPIDANHHASKAQVADATAVTLLLTQGMATTCEACLLVAYYALLVGTPLITINIEGGNYSFSESKELLLDMADEGKPCLSKACDTLRAHDIDLVDAAWRLGTTLPYVVALPFDATGTRGGAQSTFDQIDYILNAALSAKPSEPGFSDVSLFQIWLRALRSNRRPPVNASNLSWQKDDRHFDVYLSHHISRTGKESRLLKMILQTLVPSGKIFLDCDDMVDLRQESTNVNQSGSFAIVADSTYFTRPYCLLELYSAVLGRKPVVLVDVAGKGYDASTATVFLKGLNATSLDAANPGASSTVLENGLSVEDIRTALLNADVTNEKFTFRFDANGAVTQQKSQARAIASALGVLFPSHSASVL